MGDLPLPALPVPGVLSRDEPSPAKAPSRPVGAQTQESPALLGVLRQAVTSGSLSTDSLLNAIADAARVLSGAYGTALASRVDGTIVCRARSGDMAPELGAPLNTDSGISGECLRTATILVCNDSETDERVDPEVCRSLGIRSIVVVPLRGRTGMLGILEAFSGVANAFEDEQINWLRSLAEIAEIAFERERSASGASATPAAARPALFAAPIPSAPDPGVAVSHLKLHAKWYWVIGAVSAVLLTALTIRMSWRQTGTDIAASESHPQVVKAAGPTTTDAAPRIVALKPDPTIPVRQSEKLQNSDQPKTKDLLKNASEVEPAADAAKSEKRSLAAASPAAAAKATSFGTREIVDSEPPTVEVANNGTPNDLIRMASGDTQMPQFGAEVSKGAVEPTLIQRVNPVYPPQARIQELTGEVVLDAAIAKNGAVKNVSIVSGPALLAGAAAVAVRQWKYSPALLDGKPIETQKRITFIFKLP